MDDAALLALWSCDVEVASDVADGPSVAWHDWVDWHGILPLQCDRPQGFAVFNNVRKAVGRVCYQLLSPESRDRLVANVPVCLSYGRCSSFSGSEGCECVFEDMEQIICCKSFVACRPFRCVARDTVICKSCKLL